MASTTTTNTIYNSNSGAPFFYLREFWLHNLDLGMTKREIFDAAHLAWDHLDPSQKKHYQKGPPLTVGMIFEILRFEALCDDIIDLKRSIRRGRVQRQRQSPASRLQTLNKNIAKFLRRKPESGTGTGSGSASGSGSGSAPSSSSSTST